MTPVVDADGWVLDRAQPEDIATLKGWFPDEEAVRVWGGPNFRAPFTDETFVEDCRWRDMDTFCLREPEACVAGRFAAFGQLYDRNGRINMARLIAHPDMRGRGVGRRLVGLLMVAGARMWSLDEYSLFVYRDNTQALNCYEAMGFEIRDYPADQILADLCYYLTRPVDPRFREAGSDSPSEG